MQDDSHDGDGAIEEYYAIRVVDGVEILEDPLPAGDPIVGAFCPFCRFPFEAGDVLKLVSGLPATEEDERRLRAGEPHEVLPPWPFHFDCGNPKMSDNAANGH